MHTCRGGVRNLAARTVGKRSCLYCLVKKSVFVLDSESGSLSTDIFSLREKLPSFQNTRERVRFLYSSSFQNARSTFVFFLFSTSSWLHPRVVVYFQSDRKFPLMVFFSPFLLSDYQRSMEFEFSAFFFSIFQDESTLESNAKTTNVKKSTCIFSH